MSPVLADIKTAFDYWKAMKIDGDICQLNPFCENDWMFSYLFPEILLVKNEFLIENDQYWWDNIGHNIDAWGEDIYFPCNVCSEEQILRIMSEHGLL